jgi:hypothetical protein
LPLPMFKSTKIISFIATVVCKVFYTLSIQWIVSPGSLIVWSIN